MTDKTSTGPNDRPRNDTIAQTGAGLPDDTGDPIAVSDEEVERVRQKLTGSTAREELKREVKEDIELPLKGSA
ncbi:MAG TPA: hypothetical protein VIL88_05490 [Devosia sp.]|jgi:hypothetical protein|uniref:hypothetical protein n=1 Tax=Devosia sp. TaxID=1871048 RepID=UPI002F95E34E